MATPKQLEKLAGFSVSEVKASGLRLKESDFIEVGAIILHTKHLEGNTEGLAEVNTDEWDKVSSAWKSRYRNLIRTVL